MRCATRAWIKPHEKTIYISEFKDFDKNYLKSLDYSALIENSRKSGIIPGAKRIEKYVELTTDDVPFVVGFANNRFARTQGGLVRSYHPIRDFGNPAKGFIIPMPNKIDASGAGILDEQNPLKVTIAPELDENTPIKNLNFVGGGLVQKLRKGYSIKNAKILLDQHIS